MSNPARSVFVFAAYLALLGITLIVAPNTLLTFFRIPPTREVLIRIVGVLVLLIAYYYIHAARCEIIDFFGATVPARASVIVFFSLFVLLGFVKPVLFLFGTVDLAGRYVFKILEDIENDEKRME